MDPGQFNLNKQQKNSVLRASLKISSHSKVFVASGGLIKRKNILWLIETWALLFNYDDDYHLLIIGDGELYKQCIQKSVLSDNIHILGAVNNVVDYLCLADYYISASIAEGLPNAALEALSCGLKLILSDISPHREIGHYLPNHVLLYALNNHIQLEDQIKKLNINFDRKNRGIILEDVKNKFDNLKMVKLYEELSSQAASEKK